MKIRIIGKNLDKAVADAVAIGECDDLETLEEIARRYPDAAFERSNWYGGIEIIKVFPASRILKAIEYDVELRPKAA